MNFDVLTLSAVRDKIRARAVGGRVQRVVAPAPDQIALEIYAHGATQHLLINTGHQHPRLHFVSRRSPAGSEPPSPLLLLLRKWVRGGRLVEVAQIPLERVLSLTVQTRLADAEGPVRHDLIVEIIGTSDQHHLGGRRRTHTRFAAPHHTVWPPNSAARALCAAARGPTAAGRDGGDG